MRGPHGPGQGICETILIHDCGMVTNYHYDCMVFNGCNVVFLIVHWNSSFHIALKYTRIYD